jgi:hypothetical protein
MIPSFSDVGKLQERALREKLTMARRLLVHPAEKGRSLEGEVAAVVRELLPAEYGVGTGFIAYHGANGPELSSQLDIVIYDALRSGPLARLAACEIYPIEAVYGYVEVKASLSVPTRHDASRANSLHRCMQQNHEIRKMRMRRYWATYFQGSPSGVHFIEANDWLAPRAFVFAFEADRTARDASRLAQGMADSARHHGAHLHGVRC